MHIPLERHAFYDCISIAFPEALRLHTKANVHGSFMNHTWEFEFECEGEEDYWSFNSEEDIALVEK